MSDALGRPGACSSAWPAAVDAMPGAERRGDLTAERREIDLAIAGRTLCSAFAATVARRGDAEALVGKAAGERRSLSWNQVRERVRDVALGLHALGVTPGSFGVILARNRPEYLIADLGIVHVGATPVGLYNTLAPEQLRYIADHCDARVAFVEDTAFLARLASVRAELPRLAHIVLIEGTSDDPAVLTWDELLALGRAAHARAPGDFDRLWRGVVPDDPLTLIYTSGTTGPPKGVIDTHRSALWAIEALRRVLPASEQDLLLSYLPLAHAADRFLHYYAALVAGQPVAFCPEPSQIAQALLEVRPTVFVGVPRIWEKLHAGLTAAIHNDPDELKRRIVLDEIAAAREIVAREQRGEPVSGELLWQRAMAEPLFAELRARLGLDRVRLAVTGAAPTPREVLEFFHAIGVPIAEVWGMSEVALIGTCNPPERIKIGSVGRALPGVELRLAPDGELQVRGGLVMRGYHRDPETTAAALDPEGWLSTGDIAAVDADAYYTIVGRKKELLITAGGKNISPANLESLLKLQPLVGQACVIGDNRPYLTALLVLDAPAAAAWAKARGLVSQTAAELVSNPELCAEIGRTVAAINQRVSRAENIRKWTISTTEWSVESGELTPTLKLKRRVIVDRNSREIAAMYAGTGDPHR